MMGELGASGVAADVLNPSSLFRALVGARPEAVVNLATALPQDWGRLRKGTAATDELRQTGAENIARASELAGVRRLIAESLAFMYQPGPGLADEEEALWLDGPPTLSATFSAALRLEQISTSISGLDGTALRLGALYGPGTWYAPDGDIARRLRRRQLPVIGSGEGYISFVHVRDAARAIISALAADGPSRVFNIVDDEPVMYRDFLPRFSEHLGCSAPLRVPAWLALPIAGRAGVATMTRQRAASNIRARTLLSWVPQYSSWRQGVAADPDAGT